MRKRVALLVASLVAAALVYVLGVNLGGLMWISISDHFTMLDRAHVLNLDAFSAMRGKESDALDIAQEIAIGPVRLVEQVFTAGAAIIGIVGGTTFAFWRPRRALPPAAN
jgi:hypothetical protein